MLLWQKVALFVTPLLLFTGAGVAYHDGVTADDVREVGREDLGKEVLVKGKVIMRDRSCSMGDARMGGNVECFLLRDTEQESSVILVTDDSEAPAVDSVAVVRGTLKFYEAFAPESAASTTCAPGARGAGKAACTPSPYTAMLAGFEIAWVDAGNVDEAWVFT